MAGGSAASSTHSATSGRSAHLSERGRRTEPRDEFVTDITRSENEGWSGYGAERSQPVATGGKCNAVETRRNRPKPLPWVATSCRGHDMVSGSGAAAATVAG